jgi:acyl-CoA synthetase (AMP-forming)/AMP-acid ligase II
MVRSIAVADVSEQQTVLLRLFVALTFFVTLAAALSGCGDDSKGATGGTTGRSKLTVGSNRFMMTGVLAWATCLHFDEPPVNLAVAPITHAGGFVALGMGQFAGTTIMMSTPDVAALIDTIERERVTVLFLPPTLIYTVLAHPQAATADFSSLRYLIAAASPFAPEKIVEAVERFGRLVFGSGLRVDVDHATLQVRSRTCDGVTVPVESLSGGAREQLAVIGRLAAASVVATDAGDGAPVIIDDALGYSDVSRLEGLGAALAESGRTSQVIVLTCMPDRYAGVGAATTVSL